MEQELHVATVDAFGTLWRFTPMTARANKAAVPDPSRASVVICGVFSDPHQNDRMRYKFTEVSTSNPTLEIHSLAVADIRQGDVLARLDGCGNEIGRYEVTAPQANGFGTFKVQLLQIGLRASA
ncbi:MAG: hypothetical protein H6881_09950 [Rhodobiaceae bacterium]|nr:hypothetical protein [Rhodobiaceae bacterium]